jgi:hypothetical protein
MEGLPSGALVVNMAKALGSRGTRNRGNETEGPSMNEDHVVRIPIKAGMADRVRSHLAARAAQGKEIDRTCAARGVTRHIAFVSREAGEDVLFFYRSGRDLSRAGVKFMLEDSEVERELLRLLIEATHFDQATTLPVDFRWPSLENG